MLIKTIINIIEIVILAKILYRVGAFFLTKRTYGKHKKGLSIAGKINLLISNKTHNMLDGMIKAQKAKRLATIKPQATPDNVVSFKQRKV